MVEDKFADHELARDDFGKDDSIDFNRHDKTQKDVQQVQENFTKDKGSLRLIKNSSKKKKKKEFIFCVTSS